jgi:acyl-CoA thioesterase YciA
MDNSPPPLTNLTLRILAMPHDANPDGDIFGGWLVSLMDMAGVSLAVRACKERVVTVAIDKLSFLRPVFIGDEVSCYAQVVKIGNTSMQVKVEAWVQRPRIGSEHKVTEGIFTYVALDDDRIPTPISKE